MGSFFAPMLVMIFLNWRIYRTAKRTIKAIRQANTEIPAQDTFKGTVSQPTLLKDRF
jgi:hypothetical protein